MPPRFSIWMVIAGVAAGIVAGYLAGSGVIGGSSEPATSELRAVRGELSKLVPADERSRMLRAFDEAARRVGERGR